MTKIDFRKVTDNAGTPLARLSRNEHVNAEIPVKKDAVLDSDLANIAEVLLNAKSLSK